MAGSLEIIMGCMFAGKTTEQIKRVQYARKHGNEVIVFKPAFDTRYAEDKIVSHDQFFVTATPINADHPEAIFASPLLKAHIAVAIDEVQFFAPNIVTVVNRLINQWDARVILAGLPLDFRGEPFGSMPTLLTMADSVDVFHARCSVCGKHANRTQRLINGIPAHYDDPVVLIGGGDSYTARCLEHHEVPNGK